MFVPPVTLVHVYDFTCQIFECGQCCLAQHVVAPPYAWRSVVRRRTIRRRVTAGRRPRRRLGAAGGDADGPPGGATRPRHAGERAQRPLCVRLRHAFADQARLAGAGGGRVHTRRRLQQDRIARPDTGVQHVPRCVRPQMRTCTQTCCMHLGALQGFRNFPIYQALFFTLQTILYHRCSFLRQSQ